MNKRQLILPVALVLSTGLGARQVTIQVPDPLDIFEDVGHQFKMRSFPPTDIREEKENFIVEMEVPGYEKENISIKIKDKYLKVSGKKDIKTEEKGEKHIRREIRSASFERSLFLGKPVDAESATAEHKNGMLLITIPIIEGEKAVGVTVPILSKEKKN